MKNLILFFALFITTMASAQECCLLERDFTIGLYLKERDSAGLFFTRMMAEAQKYPLDTLQVLVQQQKRANRSVTVITAKGEIAPLLNESPAGDWPCSECGCPKIVIMSQDEKTLLRLIYKSDKENPYD